MNTPQTTDIVKRIDESAQAILKRISINTWIFSGAMLFVAILTIMMIYVLIWLSRVNVTAEGNEQLAVEANRIAAEANAAAAANKAEYNEKFKQLSDYINQNVSAWNKLQKDNYSPDEIKKRGVVVPVAPTLRPSGLPDPDGKELERTTRPVEKKVTVVKDHKIYVRDKKKATPTPKPSPWFRYFKQTR